jgi:glycosyltransferase involved in cell wall biosynthesis/GT2 family glycosyltransferase
VNVSVVVIAYALERYRYLQQTIQSLVDQVYPVAEIVVVIDENRPLYDQISSDAKFYDWRNVKLIFNEELKGASYARNVGIRETTSDIVAVIDDDATADRKWTQAMVTLFVDDERVGAVTGLTVPRWESDGSWLPKELYWMISCSYTTEATTYEVERSFGTNMAFRRTVLDQIGLFNERLGPRGGRWLGGEDTELVWRVKQAGFKIVYSPELRVMHAIQPKRLKFNALMKRGFVGGVSEGYMIRVTGHQVSPHTRREYLSTILFEFFPHKIREAIVHRSRIALKQALFVAITLFYWAFGFFYGYLAWTRIEKQGSESFQQERACPPLSETKPSIAIIGSRGIPANYGGFETITERLAPSLVDDGYDVWVSCEGRDPPLLSCYKGVNLFYFQIKPFRRVLYETIYDVFSLVRASVTCDSVLMLGYGAGFFFFIPKLFRKKILVNVDGREWQREKYNTLEKAALYVNERFALFYADTIIADARAIQAYLSSSLGRNSVFLPYGIDVPGSIPWDLKQLGEQCVGVGGPGTIASGEYYLIVARLERENNIDTMVEGFLTAHTDKKLVIVGNFLDRYYEKEVYKLVARHNGQQRVLFTGGIYEKGALIMLRQHCFAYLHGHSAGGTNPSLLEAMIAHNLIIAHDNPFNREVCDRFALFFSDAASLRTSIESAEDHPETHDALRNGAFNRAKNEYPWDRVLREYEALLADVMNLRKEASSV